MEDKLIDRKNKQSSPWPFMVTVFVIAAVLIVLILSSCSSTKKAINKTKSDSTTTTSTDIKQGSTKDSSASSEEKKEWWTKTVIQYDTIRFNDSIQYKERTRVIYEQGKSIKTDAIRIYIHDTTTIKAEAKTEVKKEAVVKAIEKKKVPWLGLVILGLVVFGVWYVVTKVKF